MVTEQHLIPTKGDHLRARTEKGDQSRMDMAATGVFSPMERTFFDVRITHPNVLNKLLNTKLKRKLNMKIELFR